MTISLILAADVGATMCAYLAPACAEIVVAGSVRRGKREVKDVELVAVPLPADHGTPGRDLFALTMDDLAAAPSDPFGQKANRLDQRVSELIAQREFDWDHELRRRGRRYKRLRYSGLPVDLFIVERDSFGYQLAIRTGPAAFSKQLVTSEHFQTSEGRSGLLPDGLRAGDGGLYHGSRRVYVPTEADFFRVMGLTWIAPEERR